MWKRPEISEYSSVYLKFEGKQKSSGVSRTYWVQDATEEYFEEILTDVITGFLGNEPLCASSEINSNVQAAKEWTEAWRSALNGKLALVCLTQGENGKNEVAGFNATLIINKGDCGFDKISKTEECRNAANACKYPMSKVDIFDLIGSNHVLGAIGLYVVPKFRGEGLATQILKAREGLCKNVGLSGTCSVFSSKGAQIAAGKAGFKNVYSIDYETMQKNDPTIKLPGISEISKEIKYMLSIIQ